MDRRHPSCLHVTRVINISSLLEPVPLLQHQYKWSAPEVGQPGPWITNNQNQIVFSKSPLNLGVRVTEDCHQELTSLPYFEVKLSFVCLMFAYRKK